MTVRSPMGETQITPDDDLSAEFEEIHGSSAGLEAFADDIEETEWLGGWNVEVRNQNGDGLLLRNFTTRDALADFLKLQGVKLIPGSGN